MALAATLLTSNFDATDALTTYTTASVSPAADSLLIVYGGSSISSGTASTISISGLSLSWSEKASLAYSTRRVTMHTAQCGSSPGSGAITLTVDPTTNTGVAWSVVQITGHDTTTPVVQTVTNLAGSGTTASATLAAAASSDNRPIAFTGHRAAEVTNPRANWTELADISHSSPSMGYETQWRSDAFETAASATFVTSVDWGIIASEVAVATGPPTTDVLNPSSDVTVGGWTTDTGGTSNLYQAIDEGTASDTDYIQCAVGSTSLHETGLEAGSDPLSSSDHLVKYRYQKAGGGAGATDLTASLRQGAGTEIAAWTHTAIGTTWTQANQTLTGGQADAITDYADLRLRFAPTSVAAAAPAKVGDRGTLANMTGATSHIVDVATANTTVGNYLIARVAVDNTGASGARPGLTVTDVRSNSWTVGTGGLIDPGAASAGSACYIAYTKITTQHIVGDDVTFTWGAGSPAAKAIVLEEWSGIHPTSPVAVAEVQASGSTTAFSIANTPTAANQLWYGVCSVEGPTGDTFPSDADVAALTRLSTADATAASNQTNNGAYKVATGAGAVTWNGTLGTTRDWAAAAVVFAPDPGTRVQVSWANLTIPLAAASRVVQRSGASAGNRINSNYF